MQLFFNVQKAHRYNGNKLNLFFVLNANMIFSYVKMLVLLVGNSKLAFHVKANIHGKVRLSFQFVALLFCLWSYKVMRLSHSFFCTKNK